ncbi:MAG: hypothetical protein ACYDED_11420 [Ferrimicrobium sp.]
MNTTTAYDTGCSHADYANQVGTGGLVILDFGAQVNSSTNIEVFSSNLVSDSQIQSMVVAYAQGYYNCSLGNPVSIAVGTNNSDGNGSGFGSAWAYEVNGIAEAVAPSYGSRVTIYGANDIEPGYSSMSSAEAWSQGYASVSGYHGYVDYGSADGCPTTTYTNGSCDNGWNQYGEWYVSYGAPPALSTPQVYAPGMATEWQYINLYGSHYQNEGIYFWGPLDEYPRDTSTYTSIEAWDHLTSATGQDPPFSLEIQAGAM